MNIEFNAQLTHVEEVKQDLRKKYNILKKEIRKNSGIDKSKKEKAVMNAKAMYDYANKHYLKVKLQAEEWKKINLIAKQLVSSMNSVRSYIKKYITYVAIAVIFSFIL